MTRPRANSRWILSLCILAGLFVMPSNANAAGLLDWLFSGARRASANNDLQRRIDRLNGGSNAYSTYYRGYRGSAYQPGTWNGWSQIPATNWGVTTAGYAPTTSYRTVWTPVPVTSYKVATNGCQVPCTSYSWQARRVPYTTYQPTYTAAAACNSCAAPASTYANFPPTLPASGCSSCSTKHRQLWERLELGFVRQ